MTLSHSSARHLDPHLWDCFIKVLQDQGINHYYFRWYALRVEQYLKAHSGQPPHQHTEGEVTTYLQEIGRTSQLKDWQYRQLVQALEGNRLAPSPCAWLSSETSRVAKAGRVDDRKDHPFIKIT